MLRRPSHDHQASGGAAKPSFRGCVSGAGKRTRSCEGREDELPAIGAAPRFEYGRAAAALRNLKWNGLIKPQHEFFDFAGTCFSEASLSRDDAKAALLEDAVRCDVVGGNACVERARRDHRSKTR